jgi:hypothetical protein
MSASVVVDCSSAPGAGLCTTVAEMVSAGTGRDLVVKGDQLIVATHGRGFWIPDAMTPLGPIDETARADA